MNQSPVTDGEIDRRPLQSRDTRVARGLTTWLVGKGIGPNTISTLGMVAGVFGGAAFAATAWDAANAGIWWLLAAALTQLRLLCNMLDGMVAVEGGLGSRTGDLYNELPDRIADPYLPATLETATMCPDSRAIIAGSTALVSMRAPK